MNIATQRTRTPAPTNDQQLIARLTVMVANENPAEPGTIIWRDAFCYECETNVCVHGTAQQLAQKIAGLGWWPQDFEASNILCPACQQL